MMGSGKTNLGKKLAKRLSYSFVDTDAEIEKEAQLSINNIFTHHGEAAFRKLEQKQLQKLSTSENMVVSTGGGLPCYHNNMDLINKTGTAIYLKASPVFLKSRLKNQQKNRPLIASYNEEELLVFLQQQLSAREAFYEQASIITPAINSNTKTIEELILKKKQ